MHKKNKLHHFVLDDEEKEIEKALERGAYKRAENIEKKLKKAKKAASNYLRKDKQINIRLSGRDLLRIKQVAAAEGLKYQTYISSMLHKLVAGNHRDSNL